MFLPKKWLFTNAAKEKLPNSWNGTHAQAMLSNHEFYKFW
jgi:hypothetical protein